MPRGALQGEPSILGAPPYERAPDDQCFVLALDPRSGDAVALSMRWGISIGEARQRRLHLRVEQLGDRRISRMLRCVVPLSGYIQPGFRRSRIAVTISTSTTIAAAAVWKRDVAGDCFAIITTDANEELAPALARMPVLLPPSLWSGWLSAAPLTSLDIAAASRPAPAAWLHAVAVKRVPLNAASLSVEQQMEDCAPGCGPEDTDYWPAARHLAATPVTHSPR